MFGRLIAERWREKLAFQRVLSLLPVSWRKGNI